MTRQEIDAVFARVRTWPDDRQAYAAFVLLGIEDQEAVALDMTDQERAEVEEGLREADRGEFATDEEMAALFERYRR